MMVAGGAHGLMVGIGQQKKESCLRRRLWCAYGRQQQGGLSTTCWSAVMAWNQGG